MKIEYEPIGIIHTPFTRLEGMPIQPTGAIGIPGHIEIFPGYESGLSDLEGFSHITLLYHFHQSTGFSLRVIPFLDTVERGLFSTRAPKRPNSIGLSTVMLTGIKGCVVNIENVDILDGTPLIDIKPYVPKFDAQNPVRAGWTEKAGNTVSIKKSDSRFR